LQRQTKLKSKEQIQFCEAARLPIERVVCNDRELWLMNTFVDQYSSCAIQNSPNIRESFLTSFAEMKAKLLSCDESRQCAYQVLSQHKSDIALNIAGVDQCAQGSVKK
jgi:hypothetical protein